MKNFLRTILILFVSQLLSCEYSPTETNIHKLIPPDELKSDIGVTILNENSLTSLRGKITISYSSMIHDKKMKEVSLYIDNNLVTQSKDVSGTISFNTADYNDGKHTIKIMLLTSTNSGSLLDNLGGENYVFSKEYNTIFFNGEVSVPEISNIVIKNGALYIQWNKYSQSAFIKYVVRRIDDYPQITTIGEISNINQNEVPDYSFMGGQKTYYIETIIGGVPFRSKSVEYWPYLNNDMRFKMSAVVTNDNKVLLTWHVNPFYVGFDRYIVYRNHAYSLSHNDLLVEKSNINDTSFVVSDPTFSHEASYLVKAVSKDGTSSIFCEVVVYKTGIPVDISDTGITKAYIEYVPSKNLYYVFSNDLSKSIDGTTMSVRNSNYTPRFLYYVQASSDVSPNGDYIYSIKDKNTYEFMKLNPISFEIEQTFKLDSYIPGNLYEFSGLCITDKNILVALHGTGSFATLSLIDLNNSNIISQIATDYQSPSDVHLLITEDGRYIINGRNLYEFYNNSLIKIGSISSNSIFNSNGDKLVSIVGKKIITYQCNDLSKISEFEFEDELVAQRIVLDKTTGYIGFDSKFYYYFIFDIDNNRIVKKIPIGYNYEGNYYYQNGLIFQNSRYMKINDID